MSATGTKWASCVLRALLLLMVVQSAMGVTWGRFISEECVALNQRKWVSRLTDIQGDPNTACWNTPANVGGQHFRHPSYCVNKGLRGEWGEFYVRDATCNGLRHRKSL